MTSQCSSLNHVFLARRLLYVLAGFLAALLLFAMLPLPAHAQDEQIAPPMTGVTSIARGSYFACASVESGEIYCWGRALIRVDGYLVSGFMQWPTKVAGINDAVQVAVGDQHACARRSNGRISCWGVNYSYQLGMPEHEPTIVPLQVEGVENAVDLSTKGSMNCAILGNGSVMCWGTNWYSTYETPHTMENMSDIRSVALTGYSMCAVSNTARIYCLGANVGGQIGDSHADFSGFNEVIGVPAASEIAGASESYCVISSGDVWCWGRALYSNQFGAFVPIKIPALSNVDEIMVADNTLCARTGGTVQCMGDPASLGVGAFSSATAVDQPYPVSEITDAVALGDGYALCAILDHGGEDRARCWGTNSSALLGGGFTWTQSTPVLIPGSEGAHDIASGGTSSCALLNHAGEATSDSLCWGTFNDGITSTMRTGAITPTISPQEPLVTQEMSRFDRCTVSADNDITCWSRYEPEPEKIHFDKSIQQIALGYEHRCALLDDGTVQCWGNNWGGQLGTGDFESHDEPIQVQGLSNVTTISASLAGTCALRGDGTLWCWGGNYGNSLGLGYDITVTPLPLQVELDDVVAISQGADYGCAALETGGARCWGYNLNGRLGNGARLDALAEPTTVSLLDEVDDVAAGNAMTCFLSQGSVWCSGTYYAIDSMEYYSDGMGYTYLPVEVALPGRAVAISNGGDHTCALVEVGATTQVACWGWNQYGQTGANPGWAPVEVRNAPPVTWLPAVRQR